MRSLSKVGCEPHSIGGMSTKGSWKTVSGAAELMKVVSFAGSLVGNSSCAGRYLASDSTLGKGEGRHLQSSVDHYYQPEWKNAEGGMQGLALRMSPVEVARHHCCQKSGARALRLWAALPCASSCIEGGNSNGLLSATEEPKQACSRPQVERGDPARDAALQFTTIQMIKSEQKGKCQDNIKACCGRLELL